MHKFIKLSVSMFLAFTLIACSSNGKDSSQELKILCPNGAPSLAFLSEYEDISKKGVIDLVDGSDPLITALSKNNSEYDIIVAPINIGVKLIADKQSEYRLSSIITWGNLYYVGTSVDALQQEGEIALFGQGSVPQKIVDQVNIETSLTSTYYNSATLVQQQLLAGKVNVGLLAEPLASATIAKAKQNSIHLEIIKDLQKEYQGNGYPQAAIFVKDETNYDDLFDKIDDFTNNGYPHLQEYIETIGIETLNLPSVEITVKSIERQNIHFKKAVDVKKDIEIFLQMFNISLSDDMIIQ